MNMQKRLPFYRSLDNAPRPFKCTVCPQAFKQKGHLHQHMRIHTGVKPYRCDLCGYASTIRGNLTAHIKLRHSNNNNKLRKFRCPHCGLYFKFFDSLTVHISNRHAMNALQKQSQMPDARAPSQLQMVQQSEPLSHRIHVTLPATHSQPVMPQFPVDFNPQNIPTSSYSMPVLPPVNTQSDNSILNEEIQQWEVIGNSNIEARNEVVVNTNMESESEAPTESTPVPVQALEHAASQLEMKEEGHQFPACEREREQQHEEEQSSSESIPTTIAFSPASIQQRLLYSSSLSKTYREKSSQKRAESSTCDAGNDDVSNRNDDVEMTADSVIGTLLSDEEPNSTGQQTKEVNTSNSQSQDCSQENIPNTSTDNILPTDVIYFDKSGSVPPTSVKSTPGSRPVVSSPSSRASASDMPAPVSNSFGVRCPTPISPMSHHSMNSPGLHTFNHHAPSPSTSNIPASPSRKSASKKTKFQDKDSLQCEFCDIVFGDRVMHTIHMGWHSHHHPFQCGVCGQQCKDKYDFMCHFTRGHEG
ncbi:uncharacterized protein LOC144448373 [Glandiceps talaboti]